VFVISVIVSGPRFLLLEGRVKERREGKGGEGRKGGGEEKERGLIYK